MENSQFDLVNSKYDLEMLVDFCRSNALHLGDIPLCEMRRTYPWSRPTVSPVEPPHRAALGPPGWPVVEEGNWTCRTINRRHDWTDL